MNRIVRAALGRVRSCRAAGQLPHDIRGRPGHGLRFDMDLAIHSLCTSWYMYHTVH